MNKRDNPGVTGETFNIILPKNFFDNDVEYLRIISAPTMDANGDYHYIVEEVKDAPQCHMVRDKDINDDEEFYAFKQREDEG